MLTCPYCGSETSSEYNLCENCEQQVKCANKDCGALLRPNKSKCLMCGTATLEAQLVDPSMNRYVRNVNSTSKSYTEHTEVIASDTAIGNLVPLLFNNVQAPLQPQHRPPALRVKPQPQAQLPFSPEAETSANAQSSNEISEPVVNSQHTKHDENQALALEFFEASNDELTPLVPDFKGPTRKEQLIRFLITYVWSYQHIFQKPAPSREHLLAATKRAGLYDDNFSTYFAAMSKQFFSSIEGSFKVNPAGNVEAKRFFDEMRTKSEEGAPYWKAKAKSGGKATRFSREDQDTLKKWLPMECHIGAINVRSLKPTQQVMLALWLITKDLKVLEAVKPRIAFEHLTARFTTIKGTYKAFGSALRRSTNKHLFDHNAEGFYFLHEEGEKEVDAWRNTGAPVSSEVAEEASAAEDEGEDGDEVGESE